DRGRVGCIFHEDVAPAVDGDRIIPWRGERAQQRPIGLESLHATVDPDVEGIRWIDGESPEGSRDGPLPEWCPVARENLDPPTGFDRDVRVSAGVDRQPGDSLELAGAAAV